MGINNITGAYISELRERIKYVVRELHCNCEAHALLVEIRKHDLHVSQPSEPAGYAKRIISRHPGVCQAGRENIPKGTSVYWNRSAGVWCRDHWNNQFPVAEGGHWHE